MHEALVREPAGPRMTAPETPAPHGAQGAAVLAFDFGLRFVGVAVGDTGTGIAHPLEYIDAEAGEQRFGRIAALIAEWRPARLVVGLPLDIEGGEHDTTRRARRFARQLEGRFRLPVVLVDERLTSIEAESVLRSRGRGGRAHKHESHALAAQLILQSFLDALEGPDA